MNGTYIVYLLFCIAALALTVYGATKPASMPWWGPVGVLALYELVKLLVGMPR